MSDQHALGQLRSAQLTTFEIKTLGQIVLQGGEIDWFHGRVKPVVNELLDHMVTKNLVEFVSPMSRTPITVAIAPNVGALTTKYGARVRMRLTDHGRAVAAQLEAMSIRPKLEVPSQS